MEVLSGGLRQRWVLLAGAAAGAVLLAAVQILPAAEWTRVSERAAYRVPRSIWEAIGCLRDHALGRRSGSAVEQIQSGILGIPAAGTHHAHIYDFSVGPWRWPELLWPNGTGRSFPTNRNWITIVPAERRAWTPSLYAGLLPLCLALLAWRVRRGAIHVRWLSWMAVLALLASLGWYGLGWGAFQLRAAWFGEADAAPPFGQPVGGLYWLLVVLLPQYAYFRFPAKWLIILSLAISLLAARGWDRARREDFSRLRRLLLCMGLASLFGAVVAHLLRPLWMAGIYAAPGNTVFGPLDPAGAATDLLRGMLHAALIGLLGWVALSPRGRRIVMLPAAAALIGTAVEVSLANAWMVETVRPQTLLAAAPLPQSFPHAEGSPPVRVHRVSRWRWVPANWRRVGSADRQSEIVRWESGTLAPRYHLLWDVALIESFNTIAAQDFQALLRVARRYAIRTRNSPDELPAELANAFSVRFLIGPPSPRTPTDALQSAVAGEPFQVRENFDAFPRCWIAEEVVSLSALRTRDPDAVERRTEEVFFPDGQPRDLRRVAVVEGDVAVGQQITAAQKIPLGAELPPAPGVCRVLHWAPDRWEIETRLPNSGLLVINDLYAPGWTAYAVNAAGHAKRLPIIRTNRLMRGLPVPPGAHRVVLRYRPSSYMLGAIISTAAWLTLIALVSSIRSTNGVARLTRTPRKS